MLAVLERKPEIFESTNYFDTRRITNAAKRWVFFALDVIQSERKAELSWLAVGGEESACPCLMKYGRGFVPRGLAAMLEMGGEPIPMQHLGDMRSVAWQGGIAGKDNGFVPVYPGDGLRLLKKYSSVGRKGLDEITALEGREWEEAHNEVNGCPNGHFTSLIGQPFNSDTCPTCKEAWITLTDGTGILDVVELAQFGDGMSKTLRGLEEQIKFAKVNDSRIDYVKMAEEQLKLCEDSRHWATRMISVEHGLLKTGHVGEWQGGHTYSYSPIVEMLIEQLEMKRQDQPIQEMADMVSQIIAKTAPQGGGMSAADMDFLMEQKLAKVREADAKKIAELEAKLAAATVEVFKCDDCGQEAGSLAGLKAHQRARHSTEG